VTARPKAERAEAVAAFLLKPAENLEFAIGQQGPQISAKDSGKFGNYWQFGKTSSTEIPLVLLRILRAELNCRNLARSIQESGQGKRSTAFDADNTRRSSTSPLWRLTGTRLSRTFWIMCRR